MRLNVKKTLNIILVNYCKYFIVAAFPTACTIVSGPHSDACLTALWDLSGCQPAGYLHPVNNVSAFTTMLSSLNLL